MKEIMDQLLLQAERWGKGGFYTPLKLEEMQLEECRKIRGEFMVEKANLDYEMNMLGSNKKEVLIKIERLESYVKRLDREIELHEKSITRMLDRLIGDKKAIKKAEALVKTKSTISVMLNS